MRFGLGRFGAFRFGGPGASPATDQDIAVGTASSVETALPAGATITPYVAHQTGGRLPSIPGARQAITVGIARCIETPRAVRPVLRDNEDMMLALAVLT